MSIDVNIVRRFRDKSYNSLYDWQNASQTISEQPRALTTDNVPEGTIYDRLYVSTPQRAVLQVLEQFGFSIPETGTLLFSGNFAATGEVQAWSDNGTGLPASLLDALPIATTTSKGIMQVGNGLAVTDGLVSVVGGGTSAIWGQITGELSNQTDLQSALDAKYNSANFTNDFNTSFDTRLATKTTDDLIEGNTNLYFLPERVSKLYQPNGSNSFVYTDNNGILHVDGEVKASFFSTVTYGNVSNWYEGYAKSIRTVDASNISNVVFTLGDGSTITESFGHHHSEYALNDWVVGNFIKNQYTNTQNADMWIDGKVKAAKHITIGGSADDFVKGDGSLVNKIDGGTW